MLSVKSLVGSRVEVGGDWLWRTSGRQLAKRPLVRLFSQGHITLPMCCETRGPSLCVVAITEYNRLGN